MNEPPRALRELQAWLQVALLHPEAATDIDANLSASARQTSAERLAVYQRAYSARLLEVMREMYPALCATVGEETFAALALSYLHAHPSQSYSLNHLGQRFAEYLQATRPAREGVAADWADFVIELAGFETEIESVFDGPGPEEEAPLDIAALASADATALRLCLAPGVRLLSFQFPLNDFYTAYRQGESPEVPPPAPTWLALYRRDYVVRRMALSHAGFEILRRIEQGATLAEALSSSDASADEIQAWFQQWTAAGLLRM